MQQFSFYFIFQVRIGTQLQLTTFPLQETSQEFKAVTLKVGQ